MEIHQKKAGPDCHRLKTMVKRSIEQNLWMKNFEARNGNYETSAVVKNQGTKQREQRSLRDCWQWETNGQCSKGDNCSFRHDINKRAKSTQPNPSPRSSTRQNVKNASRTRSPGGSSPSGRMSRLPCKNYLKGTCTTPFCKKWHPPECLFYKSAMDADVEKSAPMRTASSMNSPAQGLKRMLTKVQWLCWKVHDNWVAYFRSTKAVVRHADNRDRNPSLGMISPGDPRQRNPNAPKFEDRSLEETEWQERCAHEAAWKLAKIS